MSISARSPVSPLFILALGVLPWLAIMPAAAQEDENFFDSVDVNLVNVEVYVTDRSGDAVAGLTADDFILEEDGKKVEITNFFASTELTQDEAALAEQSPTYAASDRLNLVLFIDNEHLSPASRRRAIESLRTYLVEPLSPRDRITLVSYTEGSVEVLRGLTKDSQDLLSNLDTLANKLAVGSTQAEFEQKMILRDMDSQQNDDLGGATTGAASFYDKNDEWRRILETVRAFALREYQRTARTIDQIGGFVDTLAGLPGRKALFYISDGLPLRPGEAVINAFVNQAQAKDADFDLLGLFTAEALVQENDATRLFEQLGKRANDNDVTFYPVLASGSLSGSGNAERRNLRRDNITKDFNYQSSLQIMAEVTGGRAMLSQQELGNSLRRLKADLQTFYSLGYQKPKEDYKSHDIKVRVKDKKLRVRHRTSYRQQTLEQRMEVHTRSALMLDVSDNPLGIQVEFGPTREDSEGRGLLVPLMIKIPLGKINLAPGEHNHQGQISIYVGARSPDGGMSPVQRLPAPVNIPNDDLLTALGQMAGYHMTLLLRPGEHSVAVSVRDDLAQVVSSKVVNYQVPGDALVAGSL